MKEIRLHGRGGQGAVSAADILATAAVMDGQYGTSFPMYGAERRGAPVTAYVCIDDKKVRQKTQIYRPNGLIVLDPRQRAWPQTYTGLQPGGMLVLNCAVELEKPPHINVVRAGVVDATKISRSQQQPHEQVRNQGQLDQALTGLPIEDARRTLQVRYHRVCRPNRIGTRAPVNHVRALPPTIGPSLGGHSPAD